MLMAIKYHNSPFFAIGYPHGNTRHFTTMTEKAWPKPRFFYKYNLSVIRKIKPFSGLFFHYSFFCIPRIDDFHFSTFGFDCQISFRTEKPIFYKVPFVIYHVNFLAIKDILMTVFGKRKKFRVRFFCRIR